MKKLSKTQLSCLKYYSGEKIGKEPAMTTIRTLDDLFLLEWENGWKTTEEGLKVLKEQDSDM
jgi:hypothetical protein